MHCIPGFVRKSLCEQQARADYKGICYPDFHFRKGKCIFFRTHSTLINFYYQNVTLFTIWLYDRCCNLVAPQSKLLDYSFSTCKIHVSQYSCLFPQGQPREISGWRSKLKFASTRFPAIDIF